MSDELIEDMANAETQRTIAQIIAQIREAEMLAAAGKNRLKNMGIQTYKIAVAIIEEHSAECAAASLIGDYRCTCLKPERAFTEEIF